MCHYFCPQGGAAQEGSASRRGSAQGGLPRGVCPGEGLPRGGSAQGVCLGVSASRGVCILGGGVQTPQSDTIGYGQRASGTHPTEMHSCTHHNLSLLEHVDLFRTVRRGVFGMVKMVPLHNFWSVHYVDKIENETDKLLTCRQSKMNLWTLLAPLSSSLLWSPQAKNSR